MVTELVAKLAVKFVSFNAYITDQVDVLRVLGLPFNGMLVVVLLYLTTKFIYNI